ncbi:hypothetical protein VU04_12045, partial [Desulfobulbus sp. TB]|nr:hypothetical protein [Desulfobulbus sp. TB]
TLKYLLVPAALAFVATVTSPCLKFSSANALNADTKKSERKYRKTTTGNGALTQRMLEACILLKSDIDEEYEKIIASKKAFDALNSEINSLAGKIPHKDDVPLVEYNKQIRRYNMKLNELKKNESSIQPKEPAISKKKQLNCKESVTTNRITKMIMQQPWKRQGKPCKTGFGQG